MTLPNETLSTATPRQGVSYPGSNKPLRFIITVFLIALVVLAYNQFYNRTPRLVTTTGVGSKQVLAEKATVVFAVVVEAGDRNSALTNGEARFTEILNETARYSPADVNKTAFQVVPKINQLSGQIQSYQYISGAQVTFNEIANIAAFVKMLNEKEATVAQVSYLPKDEKITAKEVRELAIADAKAKAGEMAQAAGARLGKVITVTEQSTNNQGGSSVTATQSPQSGFGEGSFSNIVVSSVVQVTYELW